MNNYQRVERCLGQDANNERLAVSLGVRGAYLCAEWGTADDLIRLDRGQAKQHCPLLGDGLLELHFLISGNAQYKAIAFITLLCLMHILASLCIAHRTVLFAKLKSWEDF
ncbi:hypothetical protein N7G274_004102 [Stereocaulon virgatum]|uniref:Uncharacterized protein n=1 Tax=Stereocaulon virgatum TaxID=373712 RepID=A0ABR4AI00_9LECA